MLDRSKGVSNFPGIPDNVSEHTNVYDVLEERGFICQTTYADTIRETLGNEKVSFYIGFDPTADSLHVGHFIQIIIMMYMQKFGHRPIVLLGGGTTMIGDPSGRQDLRKMMGKDDIAENAEKFKKVFKRFINFENDAAIMENNASWLLDLNYVDFIRDIGTNFSVNQMLRAECYKQRLETGLTFLEFNYMLMQAYDFLELYRRYNCTMQFGGDDQWSNILAGTDLIRRKEQGKAYGMTFALLTTSEGKKMGKTQKGALWLDAEKTDPYEFYQYWRNVDDADVGKCLAMLTFLPMDEVNRLSSYKDERINEAKEILAFQVTSLVHGEEEAKKADEASKALFYGEGESSDFPKTEMKKEEFAGEGIGLVNLIKNVGLVKSNSEGFRLIEQSGISINGEKATDTKKLITLDDFSEGKLLIKKGKKTYHQIVLVDKTP